MKKMLVSEVAWVLTVMLSMVILAAVEVIVILIGVVEDLWKKI